MVSLVAAALLWESAHAQAILESTVRQYRSAGRYSCRLNYECTKTAMGNDELPGTTDMMVLDLQRSGTSYSVRKGSGTGLFQGTTETASVDPYLVFDHHLTHLLGMRKTSFARRLVSQDASGPFYSYFEVGPRKVAVFEKYLSPTTTPFVLTYAIDPVDRKFLSISSCGVVGDLRARESETPKGSILWSETVELTHQVFGV